MTQAPEVQAHLDLRGILDADQHRRRLASKLRRRQAKSAAPLLRLADRKSTRLNSSHSQISYAVFCLKKKKTTKSRINIPLSPCRLTREHSSNPPTLRH